MPAEAGGVPLRVYPETIDFPGFRVALRLHGTCDLKGYDKIGNYGSLQARNDKEKDPFSL